MTIIMIMSLLMLSSCEKEKAPEIKSAIVGSWTCSNHYYGGSDTYTFKKDGTYTWSSENSEWFDDERGTYTYTGTILTLSNTIGHTKMYIVIGMSKTSVVLMDEDGDSYTYYKK